MERARLTIAMKVNAVRRMRPAREIVKCSVSVQFRTVAVSYTHLTLPTTPYV